MITYEEVRESFYYNDGHLYWKKTNRIAGTTTVEKYRRIHYKGKQYKGHRLIFLWHHGYLPKNIDHKDGDTLNNKIENLREATHAENMRNSKKPRHNKSGVKGVCWCPRVSKWRATCYVNYKQFHVGHYDSLEEATKAVSDFREKYHGEFARHE